MTKTIIKKYPLEFAEHDLDALRKQAQRHGITLKAFFSEAIRRHRELLESTPVQK